MMLRRGLPLPVVARRLTGAAPVTPIIKRSYYTADRPQEPRYSPQEESILRRALAQVPRLGFTDAALVAGCRDAGYVDAARVVFARGEYAIVEYHLNVSRDRMAQVDLQGLGSVEARVARLITERLLMNRPIVGQYADALALMAKPRHVAVSLQHLHAIADEVWWLAQDRTSDFDWYTKRMAVSAIYSAAELYMLSDASPDYGDTRHFVQRRLDQRQGASDAVDSVVEWAGTNAMWSLNVAKSLWLRG